VYFLLFKRKYLEHVRDLAHKRVFYINKEGFLSIFKDFISVVFTEENCCKASKTLGLVSINTQVVLDHLKV
jgi:hypothetical protein